MKRFFTYITNIIKSIFKKRVSTEELFEPVECIDIPVSQPKVKTIIVSKNPADAKYIQSLMK